MILYMMVQLKLPAEVEQRLQAEVRAGRHATVEEAILEKLSRADDLDVQAVAGMSREQIRHDLDDAYQNRIDAVDGNEVFDRIARKSQSLRAQGK
jgi:regulator of PEP synthase PpsR (kinase-PPPase family)